MFGDDRQRGRLLDVHPVASDSIQTHAFMMGFLMGKDQETSIYAYKSKAIGGSIGIRTLETVPRPHTFQACAFDHSATDPLRGVISSARATARGLVGGESDISQPPSAEYSPTLNIHCP